MHEPSSWAPTDIVSKPALFVLGAAPLGWWCTGVWGAALRMMAIGCRSLSLDAGRCIAILRALSSCCSRWARFVMDWAFWISVRNSIMPVSHHYRLVEVEGLPWTMATAQHGASERLIPILMRALVTAFGLAPPALTAGASGNEIGGPMAAVILSGLPQHVSNQLTDAARGISAYVGRCGPAGSCLEAGRVTRFTRLECLDFFL